MEGNMENQHEEEAHNRGGGGRANHAGEDRRVLSSYINPNPGNYGSSIQKPTIQANNFELKPQLITLVQNNYSFGGAENDYFYASERGNTRGVIELNNVDTLLAQNKLITKLLADLTKKMERNQVAAITTSSTAQEGVAEEGEGDLEQANYIGNSPRQSHDPYSKTYNPGWRNHPNFGWENQQDQSQEQRRYNPNNNAAHQQLSQRAYQHQNSTSALNQSSIDERFSKLETLIERICQDVQDNKVFKEEVQSNMQNQTAAIKKLETQIGYIFKQLSNRNIGNNNSLSKEEECQAITLRSGKKLKEISEKLQEESSNEEEEKQSGVQAPVSSLQKEKGMSKLNFSRAPYPQQLKKKEDDNQFLRFLEIFKKLQINIPFAEAIEQMPLYAKFLKELMTKKRSWKNNETVILTEECSAIIQHKLPQKMKDPGSFQIPCIIGEITVEKALCDLRASINLMSVAMMRKIKIEEAKPTKMALQLADRSFKFPHGIVEDLLVKVGEFIFPADFVVLDMQEEAKTSIILGRPFLATTGAIIDVQKDIALGAPDSALVESA
ncbi:uncharacterized protein LOC130949692 [Arachis stenosperma]|uniref:uncharacterized protein LOC130949692 n=1 Tax=Arachis stenosperma TaxID=217475 RepID=UPI0025AD044A|nr:uncharacterized protein LOC130949692 [Arachis stenosperma]